MKEYNFENFCLVKSSKRIFANQYTNAGIPFYRGKEITLLSMGQSIYDLLYISEQAFQQVKTNGMPENNDILITAVGTIGSIWLVDTNTPFYFKDGNIIWLSKINQNIVLPKYLKYAMISSRFQKKIEEVSIGSNQKALTIDSVKKLQISFPKIETQQHIVDILGSIDAKIENNEKIISNVLKLYRLKFRNLAMKYEQKSVLSYIASVESGKRPLHKSAALDGSFNIPIIGASSIMGYTDDYLFNEPILVIGRVGTLGVVQSIFGKSYPSDNALIIRSKYYTFCYCALNELDYNSLNKGSTQPLITQTDIKNIQIPLIPQSEMQQFEMHNKIDIIVALKEENNMLRELKALYLKKFFE